MGAEHAAPPSPAAPQPTPPPVGEGPAYAADFYFDPQVMARARAQLRAENGDVRTTAVIFDRLETSVGDGRGNGAWDIQAWRGGDINRLWIKTEGEGEIGGRLEEAEVQLLYGRAITPFWDVQAGLRHDIHPGAEDLTHLVLGFQGLAPHWWEVDAAAYLSQDGDLTARLEAEYDQRITQRLILQPRLTLAASADDSADGQEGAGLTQAGLGLRLRYELSREFAPYVGLEWTDALGESAIRQRAAGHAEAETRWVVGLRAWF